MSCERISSFSFPDDFAFCRRQRFDQRCDLGRMHRIDHAMPMTHGPLLEGGAKLTQAGGFGVLGFGRHGCARVEVARSVHKRRRLAIGA
jgi:hypothetical protein